MGLWRKTYPWRGCLNCSTSIISLSLKVAFFLFFHFFSPLRLCNQWIRMCILLSTLTTTHPNMKLAFTSMNPFFHLFDRNNFAISRVWRTAKELLISEVKHRISQLTLLPINFFWHLGLLTNQVINPQNFFFFFFLWIPKTYAGDVTIVPKLTFSDFAGIISNPDDSYRWDIHLSFFFSHFFLFPQLTMYSPCGEADVALSFSHPLSHRYWGFLSIVCFFWHSFIFHI